MFQLNSSFFYKKNKIIDTMQRSYFCPDDDISFTIQSYLTLTEKLKVRELNREWHRKVIHSFLDLEKDRWNVVLVFF